MNAKHFILLCGFTVIAAAGVFALVPVPRTEAAISFVQAKLATSTVSPYTMSASVTKGDLLFAAINSYSATTSSPSVSDNGGNTWNVLNPDATNGYGNSPQETATWYAIATSTATITITYNTGSGSPSGEKTFLEYSGIATSSPVDGTSTAAILNASAYNSGNIATANANDLLIGFMADRNPGATWTLGSTGGDQYAARVNDNSVFSVLAMDATTTVAGTYFASSTASTASYGMANIAAFKAAPEVLTPVISSFSASPSSIGIGSSSILSWNVTNASSVLISGNNLDLSTTTASGTTSVTPNATGTLTYTLSANNANGTSTATTTITVAAYAPGTVTAIRIVGATTTVTDASSSCNNASSCNGWVAEIDIAGLSASGTYNFGLGTDNDPTNAKVVLTVTSPGYTATGATTTITRTIYGTHQLRMPYPSSTVNDEVSASGTLTLHVALSDFIYASDTNITATIGSGFYTNGTASLAANNVAVTNNSSLSYPRVIANWSWPGWTRITGSSFTVRAVAFNRSAMNGEPIAAMVFTATDQHSHTVSVTVASATIDSTIPDASKVVEYVGTLSTASLTQGDKITVNFKAYPWVGNASSTMDTSDGVNTQPTPLYAPEYFINDKNGTYGTAAAVVDAASGNDSTCAAVAESAFSSSSPPVACATINKAMAVVNAYNNTNYGRNDAAGTIYVKAGSYNWTGASNSISATAANAWLTIEPFPGVSRSQVVIKGQSGGQSAGGTPLKLENLTVNVTSSPVSIFNNIAYLWFDQVSLAANGTAPIYQVTVWYVTDGTVPSTLGGNGLNPFSGITSSPALIRGNDLAGSGGGQIYTYLGNTNSTSSALTFGNEYSGVVVTSTQPIFAYNTLYHLTTSANSTLGLFGSIVSPLGAAVVQNIFENNLNNSNLSIIGISNDGTTNSPVNNVMLWYNTLVGGRINRAYNDTGTSAVVRTLWSEVGDIRDQEAIKSDTFNGTPSGGRTGNWAELYGVGRRGVVNVEVSTGTTGFPAVGSFQMEFGGINSYNPTSTGGQPPNSNVNTNINFPGYVNRAAYNGTTGGTGGGNYELTAGSPALNLIASGTAVLPYDLAGNARRDDGTGAAGAYEYVTPPTVATSSVTNLSTSTVTLNGSVTATGGASITVEGFSYGTSTSYGLSASSTGTFGVGAFSENIVGLTCNASYHYQVFATNSAGTATSSDQTFTTAACPDLTPPSLAWIAPTANASVTSTVTLTASSSDNVAVASVAFYEGSFGATLASSTLIGATTTASGTLYSISWNTTSLANGSTTLWALSTDTSNNTSTASTTVNIQNPAILSVTTSTSLAFTAAHGATATSSQSVVVKNTGPTGSTLFWSATSTQSWLTFSPASGSLAANATASLAFIANPAGQALGTHNATATISDSNASGSPQTFPVSLIISASGVSISLTAPTDGATVSGTTSITANPTSTLAIASVQLLLDGAPLGSLLTSSPYTYAWDTTQTTDGSHTLMASTTDAGANIATSSAITVTVSNATTTPTATTSDLSFSVPLGYNIGLPPGYILNPTSTAPGGGNGGTSTTTSSSSLAALQAQLIFLQQQLQSLLAQAAARGREISIPPTGTSVTFPRDLQLWDVGSDVTQLQQLLIQADAGSYAKQLKIHGTTRTFGFLTYYALKEYQAAQGINPTGYFGRVTRGRMVQ